MKLRTFQDAVQWQQVRKGKRDPVSVIFLDLDGTENSYKLSYIQWRIKILYSHDIFTMKVIYF